MHSKVPEDFRFPLKKMIKGSLVYNHIHKSPILVISSRKEVILPQFQPAEGTLGQAQATPSVIETTSPAWLPFSESWAFPGPGEQVEWRGLDTTPSSPFRLNIFEEF